MKEKDGLVEGQPEIYMQSCENLIPKDAAPIDQTRSYEFYKFVDEESGEPAMGIRINSYHPGELIITRKKLVKMLGELEGLA